MVLPAGSRTAVRPEFAGHVEAHIDAEADAALRINTVLTRTGRSTRPVHCGWMRSDRDRPRPGCPGSALCPPPNIPPLTHPEARQSSDLRTDATISSDEYNAVPSDGAALRSNRVWPTAQWMVGVSVPLPASGLRTPGKGKLTVYRPQPSHFSATATTRPDGSPFSESRV